MNGIVMHVKSNSKFGRAKILLVCCIVFQLIISLMSFHYGDGYFRDELYQIALSNHLGWGYVDVPPLAPFLLSIVRSIFGTSLFSLHLLPAISGTVIIILTYRMVKIFDGSLFAVALAVIPMTFVATIFGSIYLYDTFDFLFWNVMIYCLVKLLKTKNRNYWIYFGIAAGFALLTKITVMFLGFGLVVSLLLTKERKCFKDVKFWTAGIIALLIFSPYIIWNACNGFPTIEFFTDYASGKLIPISTISYIKSQLFGLFLVVLPVWLLGLYSFLFGKKGKQYRILGVAYIIILALCIYLNTRTTLIFAYYPVLFAGGAVYLETILKNRRIVWLKILYVLGIIMFYFYLLPQWRPVIPLNDFIKYYGDKGVNVEGKKKGILPQFYADRFGWKDLAKKVAEVYNSLPLAERAKTAIFTGNYGEAGAIVLFGKKYGLPNPISGHNQYFLWGPGKYTGEIMIVVGGWSRQDLEKSFKSVKLMSRTKSEYCMPYEDNLPIWLCRKPKFKSLKSKWPTLKSFS